MGHPLLVHVLATNPIARADIISVLHRHSDIKVTTFVNGVGYDDGAVAVVVADTVDAATRLYNGTYRDQRPAGLVILAGSLSPAPMTEIVKAPARVIVRDIDIAPGS